MFHTNISRRVMGFPSRRFAFVCEKAYGILWSTCEWLWVFLFACLLNSCAGGGGGATTTAPSTSTASPAVSIAVEPQAATVPTGGTAQFLAIVQNLSNAAIQWEVNSVPGGDGTMGTINSTG